MTDQVTVATTRGRVLGERRGGSVRFLGIPYAEAPVGDLRFAAPVPVEPWEGVRAALAYGPTAQRRALAEVTVIPEPTIPGAETLNLNVFTPDPSPDAGLPVLVWIHGGGFMAGCSASPWYDGRAFNRDGVVLVSVGYRLGVEGFLHVEGAPDNRGVLDWIAALEWVRDNVAGFGGDPAKVTVAGQSAGGGAVQTLMATPSAHGLFRAAISVSGAVMAPQARADGLAVAARFTERTGVPATVAELRDRSDDELLDLMDKLTGPGPGEPPSVALRLAPFADGELVPAPVPEAFADGTAADVPLMLGFTRDEFTSFLELAAADLPAEALPSALRHTGVPAGVVDGYLALHRGDSPGRIVGGSVTDVLFRVPALAIAEARAGRSLPTWFYEFGWTAPPGVPVGGGRAGHCLDLPFAFDLLDAEGVTAVAGEAPPQGLADAMHAAWVAFVRDLDPGDRWPRYTAEDRRTMVWDAEPQVRPDPLRPERELWLG
ncbi:carboxylesterase/lipase family protein [Actinomadura kijaniata]|uniref:carboxylesterase/lipase family protein n=1 Tax=Actinomadura kijaniata TaxID=46161 RepID=UPI000831C66E|nr:carboxylesterase family protein [Actinomadura kijaniata]